MFYCSSRKIFLLLYCDEKFKFILIKILLIFPTRIKVSSEDILRFDILNFCLKIFFYVTKNPRQKSIS